MVAIGAGAQVFLQFEFVNDVTAVGTLLPEPFRHVAFLVAAAAEGWFFKDGHRVKKLSEYWAAFNKSLASGNGGYNHLLRPTPCTQHTGAGISGGASGKNIIN